MTQDEKQLEIWKPIPNYEEYEVSNLGRVKRLAYNKPVCGGGMQPCDVRILSPQRRKFGYQAVTLSKNSKVKSFLIHRLVATTFIPNPNNLPQVNHKDENPSNNCVENLEWCTYEYNNNYGSFKEKHSKAFKNYPSFSKPVIQMTLDGVEIQEFPSMAEAARQLNGCAVNIKECIEHPEYRNHAYGYKWKFKRITD